MSWHFFALILKRGVGKGKNPRHRKHPIESMKTIGYDLDLDLATCISVGYVFESNVSIN